MGTQSDKIHDHGNEPVQKWSPPSMGGSSKNIIKNQLQNNGSDSQQSAAIPTAEEIEKWQQEARREGYQDGLEQARQEIEAAKKRLQELIDFIQKPLQSINEEVEQQLHLLAVTLAQQLVRREIRSDPGEIIGLIRESLQLLPASTRKVSIYLHPEDAELVRSILQLDQHEEEQTWKLYEDATITRGGCQIKADKSVINATLERRLQSLAASVLGDERLEDQDERATD